MTLPLTLVAVLVVAYQDADPAELRVISYNVKGLDWNQDDQQRWHDG
jgi:hypothetical protein